MKYRTHRILSSLPIVFLCMLTSFVCAQNSQEILNQYISDLQKNPNDNALREKIIRNVQTIKPPPVVPEEAKKYINRGMAAAEDAKNEKDYKDAADEFQKAVNIAPWLGAGYRGLAVMQDKAGLHSQALKNLRLFLLTNPAAADAEAAKTLMDKIEYRQEKAARESSPEAVAAKKQKEYEQWLKKIDGRRYIDSSSTNDPFERITRILDVKGKILVFGVIRHAGSPLVGPLGYSEDARYEIQGREAHHEEFVRDANVYFRIVFTISEDGETIIRKSYFGSKSPKETIYRWER